MRHKKKKRTRGPVASPAVGPSKAELRAQIEAVMATGVAVNRHAPTHKKLLDPKPKPPPADEKPPPPGDEEPPKRRRRRARPEDVLVPLPWGGKEEAAALRKVPSYLGATPRKPNGLIHIPKSLSPLDLPLSTRDLYSDRFPLSLAADRLRPGVRERLAELVRLRPEDTSVSILTGWLRARIRGETVTLELIFLPEEAPERPLYRVLADARDCDFGWIVLALDIFHENMKWRRHYFPVESEGKICDAAFGETTLWNMNDAERRCYNWFVGLRLACDPKREPLRQYLPTIAEEGEAQLRARAERECRPVDLHITQNRGVSYGGATYSPESVGFSKYGGHRSFGDIRDSDRGLRISDAEACPESDETGNWKAAEATARAALKRRAAEIRKGDPPGKEGGALPEGEGRWDREWKQHEQAARQCAEDIENPVDEVDEDDEGSE